MKRINNLNSEEFDILEFVYSLLDKKYLYIGLIVLSILRFFFFEHKFIYELKIDNSKGFEKRILTDLAIQIKSSKISLLDERLKKKLISLPKEKRTININKIINSINYYELKNNIGESFPTQKLELLKLSSKLMSNKEILKFFNEKKNNTKANNKKLIKIKNTKTNERKNEDKDIIKIYTYVNNDSKKIFSNLFTKWKESFIEKNYSLGNKRNLIYPTKEKWITIGRESNLNYLYRHSQFYFKIFSLIFFINIILNRISGKVFSIQRLNLFYSYEIDYFIDSKKSRSFLNKELYSIIESQNNAIDWYFLKTCKKYKSKLSFLDNSNRSTNIIAAYKELQKDKKIGLIIVTGHGINSQKELLEIDSFLQNNKNKIIIKSVYVR